VAGVVVAVSPFALSLFTDARSGQRILDRFRTTLSAPGLAALKSNYATVEQMSDQFLLQTLPDVQRQLHESPAAFRADLTSHYPAIATAQRTVPPVFALVDPKIPGLLALHDDFQKVDSLPFLGLPVSSVPWLFFGAGLAVAFLGLATVVRPKVSTAAIVAAVGVGLIAVPLAFSIPGKADAGVNLQRAGKFVFSPAIAPAALVTTQRVAAVVDEVEAAFLPQTAARLRESTAQFTVQLDRRYPAVARGLAVWPSIRAAGFALARGQVASIRDAARIDGLDVRAVPWVVIGPGISVLIAGLLALSLPTAVRPHEQRATEPAQDAPHALA
jgi:hypothetical protein